MKQTFIFTIVISLIVCFSSCKKDKLLTNPDAQVQFSADSVLFDTVFAQAGSATRQIRVINTYSQKINISSIYLEKGNGTAFIVNVDGASGKSFTDVEILAHDSIYIFIQVYVNPTLSNTPVIIDDNLVFSVNGNSQKVHLEAWGQDAYYHTPTNAIYSSSGTYLAYSTISAGTNTTVTWTNDKPHIIYGYLVVDSTQTLIMQGGTRIYFYQNAGLWVYRYGTLKVQGQKGNEVTFQGYRRESEYADQPGQWDRVWINEGSINNEINYAIIKNGYIGVQAEVLNNVYNADPRRLKITNTKIFNMNKWGLYSLGFNINGGNNVISNCKENCVYLALGGNYIFLHCTFANYWDKSTRDQPCLYVNNSSNGFVAPLDTCYFGNCIVDGTLSNELNLDLDYSNVTYQPKHNFNYTVIKTNAVTNTHFNNCRFQQSLNFANPSGYDFSINNNSSAAVDFSDITDAGFYPSDINGNNRFPTPDAGAYEK